MPELPDIAIYVERLGVLVRGEPLQRIEVYNPFVTALPRAFVRKIIRSSAR